MKSMSHIIGVSILAWGLTACRSVVKPLTATAPAVPAVAQTATPTLVTVALSGPQPGATMRWLDGSTLVYAPPGEFVMGAEGGADHPAHTVMLDGFWLQQTEVTNRMYAACVRSGACKPPLGRAGFPAYTEAHVGNLPVTGVSWEQAQVYCTWIQARLPTEAQWEYAARGPDARPYPWGEAAPDCDLANFGDCLGRRAFVGAYAQGAAPFGTLDMAGNVAEWSADWYDARYYLSAPTENPLGPAAGAQRLVRGGSYAADAAQITAFARSSAPPKSFRADLGFRCAVAAPLLFPPVCQANAYQPTITSASAQDCQPPQVTLRGEFCQNKKGYVNLDVPLGAPFQVESPYTACQVAGDFGDVTRLTCYAAAESTRQVTVCSPTCYPPATPGETICDAGYRYDGDSNQCVYSVTGASTDCPAGFVSREVDGETRCLASPGELGCPPGQYFDEALQACLPASAGGDCLLYGFDDPARAGSCYQGCQPGYEYDTAGQCCQPEAGLKLPVCAAGYSWDEGVRACLPGPGGLGGRGCVTLSLTMPGCVIACGDYPKCWEGCVPDDAHKVCIPGP